MESGYHRRRYAKELLNLTRLRIASLPLIIIGAVIAASQCVAATLPTAVRGAGVVLLMPEPGPVTMTVIKQDLNIYDGEDVLHVNIFDPQRNTVASGEIPDDGQAAAGGGSLEEQRLELSFDTTLPGIYRMVLSATSSDIIFGMETNVERYVVEHGLLLNNGKASGSVYFMPPAGEFTISAMALHEPGRQQMPLYDAAGELLNTFDMTKTGDVQEFAVANEAGDRSGLWRFDIEHMDVKIDIPGVNVWTMAPKGYFDGAKSRGMLIPHNVVRYLQPGEISEIEFHVYNQTGIDGEFSTEWAGDERLLNSELPAAAMPIAAKRMEKLTAAVQAPEDATQGRIYNASLIVKSASDDTVMASAGIQVRVGEALVSQPLDLPIVLQPYQHENWQFGYAPDYIENEVYFDRDNTPFIRNRNESKYWTSAMTFLEDGEWKSMPFDAALTAKYPNYSGTSFGSGFMGCKFAFDADGGAYTLVKAMRREASSVAVLLYTPDRGQSWQIYELEGGSFDIEQFSGHNWLDGPPPIIDYVFIESHPATFCSYNRLQMWLPRKVDGKLDMGEPVVLSEDCLGSCQHSGGPPSVVTRDGKTHVVWGEVTDPDAPGVPMYIATYDHATGALGEKVFLTYGAPVNDVHNVPAVTMDSQGYIHVVTGAHGANFMYLKSLRPNDTSAGFTEPVKVLDAGRVMKDSDEDGIGAQTYISLVCDQDDTLHIAYRQWRAGIDPYHNGALYAALSIQSKPINGEWGPAVPVVVPPVPGYSIYYHKLTIDRKSNLYLSYSYYTADTTYQQDYPGLHHNRAVLVSKDRGKTWKLAETSDFAAEID